MAGDETVYLARTRSAYHTDPNCDRLAHATPILERRLDTVNPDLPECQFCSGEFTVSTQQVDLARKLEAMDPDDV